MTAACMGDISSMYKGRCITPPEACRLLFGNVIQKKIYAFERLDVHLPGQYRIANIDLAQEDFSDTVEKDSTLEDYFQHNRNLKQT